MGFIWNMIMSDVNEDNTSNNNRNEELERKMEAAGLEEWQKEEVRKGNADPWDFEEENLEDGDYYEDDE